MADQTARSLTVSPLTSEYPASLVEANHVEPVPRRIRGFVDGQVVFDTTRARYVWEQPTHPHYYIPLDDVRSDVLVPEGKSQHSARGPVDLYGLVVGDHRKPRAAKVLETSSLEGLSGTVRFDWAALDAWFEEDEQVFVHPRSPYVRVDALRSTRPVRVELEGTVLAEASSTVMVFETGLPTRSYVDRTEIAFEHLIPSDTVTACPYKGTTSQYWSAYIDGVLHADVAWSYDFPTRQLLPIAGMVAFYNEKVDTFVDGTLLERPQTKFSRHSA
jgi:uncharacterized protein (DUF427 family)